MIFFFEDFLDRLYLKVSQVGRISVSLGLCFEKLQIATLFTTQTGFLLLISLHCGITSLDSDGCGSWQSVLLNGISGLNFFLLLILLSNLRQT